MSTARAMDLERRVENYVRQNGRYYLTPAQRRRRDAKEAKALGESRAIFGKGQPTPRRNRRPAPQIESQNLKRTGER